MTSSNLRFLGTTAITGVGYTQVSRDSKRSVLSLAVEACRNAIHDAGLETHDVDGVSTYSMFNDSVPAKAVATAPCNAGPAISARLGARRPSSMFHGYERGNGCSRGPGPRYRLL